MNTNEYIIYPQIQAIEPTENMKNQEIINKRHDLLFLINPILG
jgi:hypothetical protein